MGERRDFFVSYTGADRGWAEWIAWQLEDAGYTVLVQAWDMVAGSNWLRMMNQATRFAERTIAVLSEAYLNDSPFGEAEWLAAYRRDPSGLAGRLIPIRVEDCTVDGLLAGIVYADLVGLADRDAARDVLLDAVRAATVQRRKPLVEPDFPGAVPVPARSAPPGVAARSDYLAQVRQIAPRRLDGREAELAAMAAFGTDPATGPYVWWRAAAWTGKTALMSSFVLHPPPGVQVVSFFITARYAGNSDRAAYVETVNEQLATLLGQTVPAYLTPAAQERLYWSLLEEAAERCRRDGQRLILLVDGLDEDRGVTTGPDARSVAALLPADPPAGMRVLVAGRPDPPIPADVPPGHPLHDPDVVWLLRRSGRAAAIRSDMLADLDRLRADVPIGRDMLGLVTAAGGGLSSRDLSELCLAAGHPASDWEIERLLATVSGRSFASREPGWPQGDNRVVYVLGHEEIQQEATRSYGEAGLAGYRDRLHAWAGAYRDRQWPAGTPDYLLRGYYRLLLDTGELERAADCAADQVRHDRMRDLSGGDTAALAEITDAQNAILATAKPDLPAMARLAYHRNAIAQRNTWIPPEIPAVWAELGHPGRAEQLAGAITGAYGRTLALSGLAVALARTGEPDRARAVADDAERLLAARADGPPHQKSLNGVVVAFAWIGDPDRAERLAGTVTDPVVRAGMLAALAGALADAGAHDSALAVAGRAEHVLAGGREWYRKGDTLDALVDSVVRAGDLDRAERLARTMTHPGLREQALGALVEALSRAGRSARAEAVARTMTDPHDRTKALSTVAAPFARAGDLTTVERLIQAADPRSRPRVERSLIVALARSGDHGRARALADQAEHLTSNIEDEFNREYDLRGLVGTLSRAGEYDRAERLLSTIASNFGREEAMRDLAGVLTEDGEFERAERVIDTLLGGNRGEAMAGLARALARAGEPDRARGVAARAEQVARGAADGYRSRTLADLAGALARAGDHDRSERLARSLTGPLFEVLALGGLAEGLARAGASERARTVVDDAERLARDIPEPKTLRWALGGLLPALVGCGEFDRAVRLAGTVADPYERAEIRCDLATALVRAGERGRARTVAGSAEIDAHQADAFRVRALATVAAALAEAGDHERAERIAGTIDDSYDRGRVLLALAVALARAGYHTRAEPLAHTITRLDLRAETLAGLVAALAEAGEHDRAALLAGTIADPYWQAQGRSGLASALAGAGDVDRARTVARDAAVLARTVTRPDHQARALSSLAAVLTRTGDRDEAGTLVATALSVGGWGTVPLDQLHSLAPGILTILCAALSDVG